MIIQQSGDLEFIIGSVFIKVFSISKAKMNALSSALQIQTRTPAHVLIFCCV